MKYFKHTGLIGDEKIFRSYQPEGVNIFIPHNPANSDYVRMMAEVDAGESTIEEVDDTP